MNPAKRINRIHAFSYIDIEQSDESASRAIACAIVALGLPKDTTGLTLVFERQAGTVLATVRRADEMLFSGSGTTQEKAWTHLVHQLEWACAENREPPAQFGDEDLLRAAPSAHLFEFGSNMWRVRRWPGGTHIRVEFSDNKYGPGDWFWVFDAECAPNGTIAITRFQSGIEEELWFNAIAGLVQYIICGDAFSESFEQARRVVRVANGEPQ